MTIVLHKRPFELRLRWLLGKYIYPGCDDKKSYLCLNAQPEAEAVPGVQLNENSLEMNETTPTAVDL